MPRPDFSQYVVHFTKNGPLCNRNEDVDGAEEIQIQSAFQRLENIDNVPKVGGGLD